MRAEKGNIIENFTRKMELKMGGRGFGHQAQTKCYDCKEGSNNVRQTQQQRHEEIIEGGVGRTLTQVFWHKRSIKTCSEKLGRRGKLRLELEGLEGYMEGSYFIPYVPGLGTGEC